MESLETHLAQHHTSTAEKIIQQTVPVVQHMERPATTVESQTIFRQYADTGEVNLTRQQPQWQLLTMGVCQRTLRNQHLW